MVEKNHASNGMVVLHVQLNYFFDMLIVIFSIFIMYSVQLFISESYEINNIVEFFTSFDTYFMIPSLILTNISYVLIIGFFLRDLSCYCD